MRAKHRALRDESLRLKGEILIAKGFKDCVDPADGRACIGAGTIVESKAHGQRLMCGRRAACAVPVSHEEATSCGRRFCPHK
jgi:hypothetical protein